MTSHKIRRLSAVTQVLNNNVRSPITTENIRKKVSEMCDKDFCKSSIEKDLFTLKMDFDIEIYNRGIHGVEIIEKVDFLERLKSYLNIF